MTVRHNKFRDSITLMATKAFTYYSIRDELTISSSRGGTGPKNPYVTINAASDHVAGLFRDIQILHIWEHHTETIIDFIVMDTYSRSYISHTIENVMETQDK